MTAVRPLIERFPGLFGLALFGTVAAISRAASFRTPIGRDTGAYLYVADVMLHGGTPYVDAANNKGPLTYLLFAAIDAVGGTSVVFVRLVLLAFTALAALAVAAYVTRFAGRAVGVIAGLTVSLLAATAPLQGDDPNTEQFGLAPMAIAWWLATRTDWVSAAGAGACAAVAVALNPAFVVVVPLVAFELWRSRSEGQPLRFGCAVLGGVVVLGAVVAWLGAAGALSAMWSQVGHQATGAVAATQVSGISNPIGSRNLHQLTDVPAGGLWLAGIAGSAIALTDRQLRRVAIPSLAWIAISWARVKFATYEYPHQYVPVLLGIAPGIAVGIATLARTPAARAALACLVLVTPLATYVAGPQWQALAQAPGDRLTAGLPYGQSYPVAKFLKANTRPRQRILVVGSQAQVYWLADRRASMPYFDIYSVYGHPKAAAERARDLRTEPPAAVATLYGEQPDQDLADTLRRDRYRLRYDFQGGRVWLRPGT